MRLPDGSGERWASYERDGASQVRGAGDALRQRLDRLAACHPSSPEYAEPPDSGHSAYRELAEPGHYRQPEDSAPGAAAEPVADEQDRLGGRDGEPGGRGEKPARGPGPGRPPGWRAGGAGHQFDGGAAGGLAGPREPYRPWFTAGEAPEPWFTSESGG